MAQYGECKCSRDDTNLNQLAKLALAMYRIYLNKKQNLFADLKLNKMQACCEDLNGSAG